VFRTSDTFTAVPYTDKASPKSPFKHERNSENFFST